MDYKEARFKMFGIKTWKKIKELETKIAKMELGLKQVECEHKYTTIVQPNLLYGAYSNTVYAKKCTTCGKFLGGASRLDYLNEILQEKKTSMISIQDEINRIKTDMGKNSILYPMYYYQQSP